ncbi:hypothetical protein [Stygiolobus caldivivus]|uniref:Uncharacterized protein n=1 Tax=Stygiolobus caldivivus TaxID=2824673 RepID=A0A8D5U4U9_9CREN|nr:hypothetical protein [Stygiolobus caldivivus]BCU69110.1 hypothetical protein KN1_04070 [Stygiolobus caldivivus]
MLDKDINNTYTDPKKSFSVILDSMKMKSDFLSRLEIKREEDRKNLFEIFFHHRKFYSQVAESTPLSEFSSVYSKLKDSSLSYDERVSIFVNTVKGMEPKDSRDMAREILHYIQPSDFPLWNRWVWNEEKNSGSITYILKDNVILKSKADFFSAINELKTILSIFGFDTSNYYPTTIFLVYSYVRYLDYTTHLAIDKKVAGLLPTHLSTTALVLGLKPFLKVIKHAHS